MHRHSAWLILVVLTLMCVTPPLLGIVVEMLNGQKWKGTIVSEDDTTLKLEVSTEGATMVMPLAKSKIHAITDDKGKRTVINEKKAPVRRPRPKPVKKEKPKPEPKPNFDWPCWRGPNRNGISTEKGWKSDWDSPPPTLWSRDLGEGYSCVSIANGRAYTMGNDKTQDTVWCFDAESGKELWKRSYSCGTGGYPGPRATPAVDSGIVYTLSRNADLHAYEAATGKVLWKKKLPGQKPKWGFSGSPLVISEMVIVSVGTSGMAFNKRSLNPTN